jgi:hypothetical protein
MIEQAAREIEGGGTGYPGTPPEWGYNSGCRVVAVLAEEIKLCSMRTTTEAFDPRHSTFSL